MSEPRNEKHKWAFSNRFRRNSFGWNPRPAINRIREAVREIKRLRREDPLLAAHGAVLLLEKLPPAILRVDSSCESIGREVDDAISQLVPIITEASAEEGLRRKWLARLWTAVEADRMPYLEQLAGSWGMLCTTPELASDEADRLIPAARSALGPGGNFARFLAGIEACLNALLFANRPDEILELLEGQLYWPLRRYAVRALISSGRKAEAIRYAEESRSPQANDREIDRFCEEILLSSGFEEDAYHRYGLGANRVGIHVAWFQAVRKRYPRQDARRILADLVAYTPGEEGKWSIAARSVGLAREALEFVKHSPSDPGP